MSIQSIAAVRKVLADADAHQIRSEKRLATMIPEVDGFISADATLATELATAKSLVDAKLAETPGDAGLVALQASLTTAIADNATTAAVHVRVKTQLTTPPAE